MTRITTSRTDVTANTMNDLQQQVAQLQHRIQELERQNELVMRDAANNFQQRLGFERLLAQIVSRFVQVSFDELDQCIEQGLSEIGQFVECDRSFLCQYHDDYTKVDNTHEWCAEGVPSLKSRFQDFEIQGMGWFTSQMMAGQPVQIARTEDLGEEAALLRQILQEIQVRSLLCVPLQSQNRLRGFIGFAYTLRPYQWLDEQVDLLRIVGETVLSVLDRRDYEQKLRSNEEMFRVLANHVPGVVYTCQNDDRYSVLYLNDHVADLTGYTPDDFLQNRISFIELYHPDDRATIIAQANRCIAARQPYQLEYRLRHRNGTWRWVEERGQAVFNPDGSLRFLEGTIFDISERKRAQEQLQSHRDLLELRVQQRTRELQAINEQLQHEVEVRRAAEQALRDEQQLLESTLEQHEYDRKLLAYEIHDGLAQYLTAAVMHISACSAGNDARLAGQLELVRQMIRRSLEEARRLISGLRPPILDEAGIIAALEYLVQEREPVIGRIHFHYDVRFKRLSPLLECAIYRISQEALNNVIKHSGAKEVFIELVQESPEQLRLSVRDCGRGFDPTQVTEKSYGLRGVRERALTLGGKAEIITAPGEGTEVRVFLPIQERR